VNKTSKIIVAALSSIALTFGLFSVPANAETSGAALVRFISSTVERTLDPTSKEVKYLAGDTITISVSANFKGESLSANSVVSGNALVINPGLTVVSGSAPGYTNTHFNLYGQYGNVPFNSNSAETTFTATPTSISPSFYYSATAVTDVTIKVEPTFTIRDHTFGTNDFSSYNTTTNTGNFMPGSQQNVPIVGHSIDSTISFDTITACVNTTGLAVGDTLVASFDLTDGTNQVGVERFNWSVRNSQGMYAGSPGMNSTYAVPVIAEGSKLTFSGGAKISSVVDEKTYTLADYKVVKQGSSNNLLTHCKETLATGTLSASGSTVTGTLNSTPDGGGGNMPSPDSFDSYSCALYAIADTGFVTSVKTDSAFLYGQNGPVTNPTCDFTNVDSGTYKMGIRGIGYRGIGSETILSSSVTVGGSVTPPAEVITPPAEVITPPALTVTTPASATPAKGSAAALATIPTVTKSPKLTFDSSANGLGKSSKKSLKKVADIAKDGYGVRVTGAAGIQAGVSEAAVKALAKKRAIEIRDYLVKQGVDKDDIIIKTKIFPIGKAPSTLVKVETLS
jgi:hypothetical protein